jgi:hypothetical protein
MWQDLIVYLIVMLAASYISWRWMSMDMRAGAVSYVILFAKRLGLSNQGAMKWQLQAAAKTGCGSCGPCKACHSNRPESRATIGS